MHPALVPAPWPGAREGSVAEVIMPLADALLQSGDLVLLGLCNEVGVIANGGRAGTAQGPMASGI